MGVDHGLRIDLRSSRAVESAHLAGGVNGDARVHETDNRVVRLAHGLVTGGGARTDVSHEGKDVAAVERAVPVPCHRRETVEPEAVNVGKHVRRRIGLKREGARQRHTHRHALTCNKLQRGAFSRSKVSRCLHMLFTAPENGLGNLVVGYRDLRRSQRAGALELLANEWVDGRPISHEHKRAENLVLGGRRRNVVAQGRRRQVELELCLAQHRHGLAEVCLTVVGGPQLVPVLGEVTNRAVFERLCDGHPVAVHIAKRARVGLPAITDGLDALLLRDPAMLDSHVDALVTHGGYRRGAVGEGPDLRGHLGDGGGVVVTQVLEDVTRKTSRQLGACVARPDDRIEGVLVPLQDFVRHAVPPAFPSD